MIEERLARPGTGMCNAPVSQAPAGPPRRHQSRRQPGSSDTGHVDQSIPRLPARGAGKTCQEQGASDGNHPDPSRPATLADYDAVSTLLQHVDHLHAHALPDLFQASDEPARSHAWFTQMITGDDSVLFVAEHQGILAGPVLCQLCSSPAFPLFVPRRYVQINELVVHESCQRQGIGCALVQRAHAWARALGASDIELTVYEFNASARRLYEQLGYQTVRRTMRHRLPS